MINPRLLAIIPAGGGSKGLPRKKYYWVGRKALNWLDNWGFFAFKIRNENLSFMTDKTISYVIPEKMSRDIDGHMDLKYCAVILNNESDFYV